MRRAIGIVRVSHVGGREGQSFASPREQRDRIMMACDRDGLELVLTLEELDVSGGTPLERRHGLRRAVEAVEAGEAEVIVAAYFDRLVRSLRVQGEVVERVEAAGGSVLAVDVGHVTNRSAGQWLSGTMLGAVSEYHRRTTAERVAEAQARAVARGVLPYPSVPPGYERGPDGVLVFADSAEVVREAFELRAGGATIAEVRSFLAGHGIVRSYRGVSWLLGCRVYLGEIHFGKLENLTAHEPLVDADTFGRVQDVRVQRGRHALADRLLARLGVLRCGGCDGLMVAGVQRQGVRVYPLYRCGRPREDCGGRVTISAPLVEGLVVAAVREALADVEGRASVESNARAAEAELERASVAFSGAVRAFAGFEDESDARERLLELRAVRDRARERVEHLSGHRAVVAINASADWDRLSVQARRALIRATVSRVVIASGRGAGRVRVELVVE